MNIKNRIRISNQAEFQPFFNKKIPFVVFNQKCVEYKPHIYQNMNP